MKGTLIMEAAIATVVFGVVASTYAGLGSPTGASVHTTMNQSSTQFVSVRLPVQP